MSGTSSGKISEGDYATVAYDASTGARLWAGRYNGPVDGWDAAQSAVTSPDGSRVLVTGAITVTGWQAGVRHRGLSGLTVSAYSRTTSPPYPHIGMASWTAR